MASLSGSGILSTAQRGLEDADALAEALKGLSLRHPSQPHPRPQAQAQASTKEGLDCRENEEKRELLQMRDQVKAQLERCRGVKTNPVSLFPHAFGTVQLLIQVTCLWIRFQNMILKDGGAKLEARINSLKLELKNIEDQLTNN